MWRILVLAIVGCLTLKATTTVSYTCTLGTTTANPCPPGGLSNPSFGINLVQAQAAVELGPSNISTDATSEGIWLGCSGCPQPFLAASAEAIASETDYTVGPVRSGFIQISETILSQVVAPGPSPGTSAWSISDGSHLYEGCLPVGAVGQCTETVMLPFELGVAFVVNATAQNSFSITSITYGTTLENDVTLSFGLYEADLSGPVPILPAPEPSTFALLFIGTGLVPVLLRFRTAGQRD